jgi:SAM-dependent methyltransferase
VPPEPAAPATDDPAHGPDRARRLAARQRVAPTLERWAGRNRYYHRQTTRLFRQHVSPGARVLHIGCGIGDLLAAVEPGHGVGIDLSPDIVARAVARHPHLRFEVHDPEDFKLAEETFDYVIVSGALADAGDIQALLECARRVCHSGSRLLLFYHNALWGPPLRLASAASLRRPTGEQNWLGPEDFENLLTLSGFQPITRQAETLLPIGVPLVSAVLNRFVAKFWPFRHLCLSQFIVARAPSPPPEAPTMSCTVVIPTRDEKGNVASAIERLPAFDGPVEVIFVDGNSPDGTADEVRRIIDAHPDMNIRLIEQGDGVGKGDAVRKGFAAATGDILMILDGDLTVPPEELPKFYRPIADGTAEFVNGTRLVYPMEDEAMRFLNKCGNRVFSLIFTWLLGQRFRDTLCGTKVLTRRNYDIIAANRSYFGEFDPFGDFDLIFGAARADLKIIEVPVRYRARTYGSTSIHRFRHGWLLLKMSWVAFRKLKLR